MSDFYNSHHSWLREPSAEQIFNTTGFDKSAAAFPEFLLVSAALRRRFDRLWSLSPFSSDASGTLYTFSTSKPNVEHFDSQDMSIGMIYKVPLLEFRNKWIYRFHPIVPVPWNYDRCHDELMALWSLAGECDTWVFGMKCDNNDDVYDVCGGRRWPDEIGRHGFRGKDWDIPVFFIDPPEHLEESQERFARYRAQVKNQKLSEHVYAAREYRLKILDDEITEKARQSR